MMSSMRVWRVVVVSATPAGSSVSLSGMGDADSMSNQAAYLEVEERGNEEGRRKKEEGRRKKEQ
jgi:hypothetical protein